MRQVFEHYGCDDNTQAFTGHALALHTNDQYIFYYFFALLFLFLQVSFYVDVFIDILMTRGRLFQLFSASLCTLNPSVAMETVRTYTRCGVWEVSKRDSRGTCFRFLLFPMYIMY